MGPRGLVSHHGGAGGVLEAWYYTRAAGTDVVHGATTGLISMAARGVDIQGLVIRYWGSVGDGSDWYTGVKVYWYTGILKAHRGVLTSTFILLLSSYFCL